MPEPVNKCDQDGCEEDATFSYVWTKPQKACTEHMVKALNIATAMGYPTVAATVEFIGSDEDRLTALTYLQFHL